LLRASIPTTIDIRLDIDPGCRPVLADQTQIHQVILNLCTNAAQAMEKEGGLLEIRLIHMETYGTSDFQGLTPGSYVQLSVKDTGHGIEKQILDKIFDPYFTTKKIGKGSGMGLAMVHGIVKRHMGVIHVDSTPNVGSVFHVFLPASDQAVLDQNKKVHPLVGGSEHILVVDDEPSIADMTRMRLERLGYTVTSKTSSPEALDLFCRYPDRFDLVITDQTMPHMTGEKMAGQMISIRKDIPIILSTGYSSRIDEEKTGQMGICALLMKPVDMRELSVCIRRVLDDPPDIPKLGPPSEKKE
ncbi:MAG: response regulator, partial [Proteobacteria bacterium]|nr:response regulator [Pseudomonadota bacterium]